jgi:hypothetical protein
MSELENKTIDVEVNYHTMEEISKDLEKAIKKIIRIEKENAELTRTMETLIKCLSEFEHNPHIQGIGRICAKKLEEIKGGQG